jgi:ADP-L-glycero-D-manno-heptose 6-epimerase
VAWVDTPVELRDRYQYFTEAKMDRLAAAGYRKPFASVEEGVRDYVGRYLATDEPYR